MESLEIPVKKIRYTKNIPDKYARVFSELTWRCYEKYKINGGRFEDLIVDLRFKYRDVGYVITYSDITTEADEKPVHLVRVVDLSHIVSNMDILRSRDTVVIPIASAVYYGCDRDYEYLINVDVDTRWLKDVMLGAGSQRATREFMDYVADILHEFVPAVP